MPGIPIRGHCSRPRRSPIPPPGGSGSFSRAIRPRLSVHPRGARFIPAAFIRRRTTGAAGNGGTVAADGQEPAAVTTITSEGSTVTVAASHADATILLKLTSSADSLVGTYDVNGGDETGSFRAGRVRG